MADSAENLTCCLFSEDQVPGTLFRLGNYTATPARVNLMGELPNNWDMATQPEEKVSNTLTWPATTTNHENFYVALLPDKGPCC